VSSYLPHEGKVVLDIRQDIPRLRVRIPEWAGFTKIRFVRERDGEVIEGKGSEASRWSSKHFLLLGEAYAGEKITVTFPLSFRKTLENAVGQTFETEWRGDDVVGITPQGKRKPLYSGRKAYDTAPMREGDYRRPERELVW
jgi:hypothetical protein